MSAPHSDPPANAAAPFSAPPATADTRLPDELAEGEKTLALQEGSAVSTGIPYPSATGAMTIPPAVPLPSTAVAEAATAEPSSSSEKMILAHPTSTRSGASETSEKPRRTSTTSSGLVGEKHPKKKRWGKSKKDKEEEAKKSKQKEAEADALPPIGFFQLFRFHKTHELIFNFIGLFLAAAAGATQPLMTLIFGRLTTSFTNYAIALNQIATLGNSPEATAAVEAAKQQLKTDSGHNALYLLAIGVGMFFCTYCYMFIWNWTGEVASKRVRENYLRAVLRQEVRLTPSFVPSTSQLHR
jgi:ATP-binding cassette subfamily B (MDR/TAP) protein 1